MRIVIVGVGQVALALGRFFSTGGHDVVIVGDNAAEIQHVEEVVDAMTLVGHATHRRVLDMARVSRADIVYVTTVSDATNLVAAAMSAERGAKLVIAQVGDPDFYESSTGIEHAILGIDAVMCPARIASNEVLRQIRRLDLPFVSNFAEFALQVVAIRLREGSKLIDASPDVRLNGGAELRAIVRDGHLRAAAEVPHLDVDDLVLVAGPAGSIPEAQRRLGHPTELSRVVVVGGGPAGVQLCQQLIAHRVVIQLIESDRSRAVSLAEQLPEVKVIHADGTNPDTLRDLQVDGAQVLVATTEEDEINLTTALLARQLGVPYTFTVVERTGYTEIYQHFGITGVVSRQEVTANAMLAVFERGAARATVPLGGCQHVVTDVTVPGSLTLRLGDLALPPQTHLLAHVRGTQVLPIGPEREVHGRDVLVVATLERHLSALRRTLRRLTS